MSGAGGRGSARVPRTFVREATGLTKELSLLDIFVYNTNNQNIGLGVLFILLFVPAFYSCQPSILVRACSVERW